MSFKTERPRLNEDFVFNAMQMIERENERRWKETSTNLIKEAFNPAKFDWNPLLFKEELVGHTDFFSKHRGKILTGMTLTFAVLSIVCLALMLTAIIRPPLFRCPIGVSVSMGILSFLFVSSSVSAELIRRAPDALKRSEIET